MQYKLLALSALVTLAAATPTPRTTTPSDQCCTTVTTKDDPEAIKQAGLVNINISNVNVPIGLNCVPITVIGGGAAGCNSNAVTCDSSEWGGLIAIGCLPINFRRNDTPPPPPTTPTPVCCESSTTASDPEAKAILDLLNINVSDVNVPVGLTCVPITVVGGGAAGCNAEPLNCESSEASWHGLIAIGCVPIDFRRDAIEARTGTPPPPPTSPPQDLCCQSVTSADDPEAVKQAGLVNVDISNVNVPIGLTCVPITVIGGGAAGCNAKPVTCDSSEAAWLGLIAIGCVPIVF